MESHFEEQITYLSSKNQSRWHMTSISLLNRGRSRAQDLGGEQVSGWGGYPSITLYDQHFLTKNFLCKPWHESKGMWLLSEAGNSQTFRSSSTSHLPARLERSSDGEEPAAAPQLPCVGPSPALGSSPGSSAPTPPWVLGWVSCPSSLTEDPPWEWAGWNGHAVLNIRSLRGPVMKSTQIHTSLSEILVQKSQRGVVFVSQLLTQGPWNDF